MRVLSIVVIVAVAAQAQSRDVKPGWNLFTPAQDIEIGRESAKNIESTRSMVRDAAVLAYVERVGARLAKSKHAGEFEFHFHVVNDRNVNAFAFPGGQVFVDSGSIAVLDNETELAAVLAHEMSHVALRHGTHQASKAVLLQAPAQVAAGLFDDHDSNLAKIAKLGIDFTTRSILLRYSRDAEMEADLNGVRILYDSGYDPQGLQRFFEKLDEQGNQPHGRFATFLSDHPAPANRIQAIDEVIREFRAERFTESDPREFGRVKKIVAAMPPPLDGPSAVASTGAPR